MPYNPIADNTELTAAHLLAEVYNQVISQVTSASRPGSPAAGQMIYETDTGLYQAYSGTGWVQFGGLGTWTSYTPTLTQSTAVTKTMLYGRSTKIGRLVTVQMSMQVTGTGVANNKVTLSLPHTAAASVPGIGTGYVYDASVNTVYPAIVQLDSTTALGMIGSDAGSGAGIFSGMTGSSFAAALANTDIIFAACSYESAA